MGYKNLRDIHTNINLRGGEVAPVAPQTIWILLAIAAAVLLIACINFYHFIHRTLGGAGAGGGHPQSSGQ